MKPEVKLALKRFFWWLTLMILLVGYSGVATHVMVYKGSWVLLALPVFGFTLYMIYSVFLEYLEEAKKELKSEDEEELKQLADAFLEEHDENVRLHTENEKLKEEIRKIHNGIPSDWAYAILRDERNKLAEENSKLINDIKIRLTFTKRLREEIIKLKVELEASEEEITRLRKELKARTRSN